MDDFLLFFLLSECGSYETLSLGTWTLMHPITIHWKLAFADNSLDSLSCLWHVEPEIYFSCKAAET